MGHTSSSSPTACDRPAVQISAHAHGGAASQLTVGAGTTCHTPNTPLLHPSQLLLKGLACRVVDPMCMCVGLPRAGGWLLATAHIVTAIIGAGVLGLPYALSWLGE